MTSFISVGVTVSVSEHNVTHVASELARARFAVVNVGMADSSVSAGERRGLAGAEVRPLVWPGGCVGTGVRVLDVEVGSSIEATRLAMKLGGVSELAILNSSYIAEYKALK